ncbi:MAG: deoxyribose-phosphate aldolase, partial [Clostridia bacterium]
MLSRKAIDLSPRELACYIDQSVLKPEFTQQEIQQYILEGIEYGCRTVCVNPSAASLAKKLCEGSSTEVCVVCDFPFGLSDTPSKVHQAEDICAQGGIFELDVVANYGWIRSGMWQSVTQDIAAVAEVCHKYGTALKVIFETDALTLDQVRLATECAIVAKADFAKTSTGFFTGGKSEGANPEVIRAMMEVANGRIKIKGAGGIRTRERFLELIDMGIDRMGIGYRSTP